MRSSRHGIRLTTQRAKGFTLLELIVVIAIFTVLAAMAYGGLSSVLNSRARVEAQLTNTAQYQKVFQRLRQDFQNAAGRPIRDNDGQLQPAFVYDSYTPRVDLPRAGWATPLDLPRTGFERVSYAIDEDNQLVRTSWRVLDRARQTEPVKVILLAGVDQLTWSFLDDKLQPSDTWPPSSLDVTPGSGVVIPPPVAVEMRMRTRDWGDLRFLFKLGAAAQAAANWGQALNPNANQPPDTTPGTTSGPTTSPIKPPRG